MSDNFRYWVPAAVSIQEHPEEHPEVQALVRAALEQVPEGELERMTVAVVL
jgi:hypothetical protein